MSESGCSNPITVKMILNQRKCIADAIDSPERMPKLIHIDSRTNVYVYAVDPRTNSIVDMDVLQRYVCIANAVSNEFAHTMALT